ncbi:hypothetical protein [Burkholderia stagnalis]|uniref:hypothetical protein n=1 Tax=Burkholderia stagnalis TaxID=1503054 RepID=UPI0012D9BB06|nr:hypothetical protein [Burkholderia stagnalis]
MLYTNEYSNLPMHSYSSREPAIPRRCRAVLRFRFRTIQVLRRTFGGRPRTLQHSDGTTARSRRCAPAAFLSPTPDLPTQMNNAPTADTIAFDSGIAARHDRRARAMAARFAR